MSHRTLTGIWIALAALATLVALPLLDSPLALVWGLTALALAPGPVRRGLTAALKRMRRRPALFWLLLLGYLLVVVGLWQLLVLAVWAGLPPQQVLAGTLDAAEQLYLLICGWLLLFLAAYGLDGDDLRAMGQRLSGGRATGPMLSLTGVVIVFLIAELVLRLAVVQSDGFGFTLMNLTWFRRHWRPVNAQGYRDYALDLSLDESVRRVLVVGDSFVAGYGLNDIAESFPHVLGALLGEGYAVNIVAQPAWETTDQLAGLDAYPARPDVLILSHYVNDLQDIATQFGFEKPQKPDPPPAVGWLINSYYLPNLLYWHLYYPAFNASFTGSMAAMYQDADVWARHEESLAGFIERAEADSARLVVIVWPQMAAVAESDPMTTPVERFFAARGVPVIDMTDALIDLDPASIVVNAFDSHPSALSHRLAAERLYEILMR